MTLSYIRMRTRRPRAFRLRSSYSPETRSWAATLSRSRRTNGNMPLDNSRRHQVVLYTGAPRHVLAAKMRHELEHARQWIAAPDGVELFMLHEAAMYGIEDFMGSNRRGSRMLYNIVPHERDANSAAARFMHKRLAAGDIKCWQESAEAVLFRMDSRRAEPRTVGLRAVCMCALAAERVEEWGAPLGSGWSALVGGVAEDAGVWGRLRGDEHLQELVRHATLAVPTAEDIEAAAPDCRAAWVEVRRRVLVAVDEAYRLAEPNT
jgi:hypothetical protein